MFTLVLVHNVNLFHCLSAFLIIGFGLDYSIFRFCNMEKSNDGVFISCITTVFSFLLLSFTGFKLISSIGITLATGLTCSYLLSCIFIENNDIEVNKNFETLDET